MRTACCNEFALRMPKISHLNAECLKLVVLFLSVLELYVFSDESSCIDVTHVEYVNSCPLTEQEWRIAEAMKNCSSKVPFCHDLGKWKYHCLRNHYKNQTVQLCGRPQKINGYSCAEYNVGGDVIQENYDTSCEQSTPPCPFQYSSDEVYKYTICIETMIEDQSKTNPPSTTLGTLDPNEDKTPYLRELPLIAMLAILLMLLACYVIYRKCEKQEEPMSTVEERCFIKTENVQPMFHNHGIKREI